MTKLTRSLLIQPRQVTFPAFCNRQKFKTFAQTLALAGVCLLGVTAQAETAQSPQTRYQADRAACLKNDPHHDRDACLKEAGAALQESKKSGAVKSSSPHSAQDMDRNRTLRCQPLPLSDREDCMRRMQGEGVVEGSVEAGGVLRKLERPVATPPLTQ